MGTIQNQGYTEFRTITADMWGKAIKAARIRRAMAHTRELGKLCRSKVTTPGQGIFLAAGAMQGPRKPIRRV